MNEASHENGMNFLINILCYYFYLRVTCTYDSWVQTPGAVDLIREQVENDASN